MNKKGSFIQDNMGWIVLLIIALLILIAIALGFFNTADTQLKELQSCQVAGGIVGAGNGVCRDMEDDNCYKIGSCPKETPYCCISLEEKEKSILPATYGGNANYDFTLGYIGPATPLDKDGKNTPPGKCVFDNSYQTSMQCPAGEGLFFDIKVKIINKGRAIIPVKATPYYVFNDDPNRIFNFNGTSTLILNTTDGKNAAEAIAKINIKSSEAVDGTYIKIYPYARCDSRDCKRNDVRGILRNNLDPEVYMTIKFIKTTP